MPFWQAPSSITGHWACPSPRSHILELQRKSLEWLSTPLWPIKSYPWRWAAAASAGTKWHFWEWPCIHGPRGLHFFGMASSPLYVDWCPAGFRLVNKSKLGHLCRWSFPPLSRLNEWNWIQVCDFSFYERNLNQFSSRTHLKACRTWDSWSKSEFFHHFNWPAALQRISCHPQQKRIEYSSNLLHSFSFGCLPVN